MRNLFFFFIIYIQFIPLHSTRSKMLTPHDIDKTCGGETFNPVSEHSHGGETCKKKKVKELCVLNQTSKKGLAAVTAIQNGFLRMLPRKLRM